MHNQVPCQAVLIDAVQAAVAKNPSNKYLSVMEVHQFIPRDQGYVIPTRSTIVQEAIQTVFPGAQDIGGGIYQIRK